MSSTLQHRGSVHQTRRVHIALASETGKRRLQTALIEEHRARKIAALKDRIEALCHDPEVGGMAVSAVLSEHLASILKGYGK